LPESAHGGTPPLATNILYLLKKFSRAYLGFVLALCIAVKAPATLSGNVEAKQKTRSRSD
jgi:hypothetical protein